MTTPAITWFPPAGNALAVLLGVIGMAVTIAAARYFASTRLSAYYDGLNSELSPTGPWGDQELMAYTRSLLDQSERSHFAFSLTLMNTGWFGIKFNNPIHVQLSHPEPLQVKRLGLAPVEPVLSVGGDFSKGELHLKPDVLKRGEVVRVLVGSDNPIYLKDVQLRLDDEPNLPRQIVLQPRAGYLPLFGPRLFGAFDLICAGASLAMVYIGVWLVVEVIPAWSDVSWVTAFKIIGDVAIFVCLVLAGFFMMTAELASAVFQLVTGSFNPGPIGSLSAESFATHARISSVPGRQ